MDELTALQEWYRQQCDGDWEHDWRIHIGTLDNPGWDVRINLADTPLAGGAFPGIEDLAPEHDWIRCWVDAAEFHGVGGRPMLRAILRNFLEWARSASRARG